MVALKVLIKPKHAVDSNDVEKVQMNFFYNLKLLKLHGGGGGGGKFHSFQMQNFTKQAAYCA
jgi:hypothetical protein